MDDVKLFEMVTANEQSQSRVDMMLSRVSIAEHGQMQHYPAVYRPLTGYHASLLCLVEGQYFH